MGFDLLLTLRVEIDSADPPLDLIVADVVKPFEARAGDRPDPVVGDQKVLFPPHEDVLAIPPPFEREIVLLGFVFQGLKGGEALPVALVDLFGGTPVRMLGDEGVGGTNEFALEIGG